MTQRQMRFSFAFRQADIAVVAQHTAAVQIEVAFMLPDAIQRALEVRTGAHPHAPPRLTASQHGLAWHGTARHGTALPASCLLAARYLVTSHPRMSIAPAALVFLAPKDELHEVNLASLKARAAGEAELAEVKLAQVRALSYIPRIPVNCPARARTGLTSLLPSLVTAPGVMSRRSNGAMRCARPGSNGSMIGAMCAQRLPSVCVLLPPFPPLLPLPTHTHPKRIGLASQCVHPSVAGCPLLHAHFRVARGFLEGVWYQDSQNGGG